MAKPFDATLNSLIDERPSDWADFLAARVGIPTGPAHALDTDLSATLQADRLFRLDGSAPAVLHLELESTGRLGIPRELLRYNAFTHHLTELPVHSVLVLLRPRANATDLTGVLSITGATGVEYLRFQYTVVRVWQESVADLLAAGPGIAPLALLTDEANADLSTAFERYWSRLRSEALPRNVEQSILSSLFVLCGLRHDPHRIEELYRNLSMTLEDSTTYQLILTRGELRGQVREAQSTILRLGVKRFGPASEAVQATVRGLANHEHLQRIADRLFDAASWEDLLATA